MNRYRLVHTTEFHLRRPRFRELQRSSAAPDARRKAELPVIPADYNSGIAAKSYRDAYGNWVHQFNVLKEHRHLKIETDSVVLNLDVAEIVAETTLEQADQAQDELYEEFYDYLVQSNYVPHLAALDDLIATAERNGDGTAFGFAKAASLLIHERFQYVAGATHVQSSIEDALRLGVGVCQDFAHLLLGAMRKRGLPARYVSGYLVPERGDSAHAALEEVIGGQASHAWVEVHIPGCGWMALDPTLGMAVGARHVRIAYGRDYGDVAPVRGLYNGHAGQRLSVDVQLRPDVDVDGHEQLSRTAACPAERNSWTSVRASLCNNSNEELGIYSGVGSIQRRIQLHHHLQNGDTPLLSTVLVVDEDPLLADTLTEVINRFDNEFLSFAAYDVQTALQLAREVRPDLVVTAAIMPDAQNLSHALTMRDTYGCKVLLMSAYPETAALLHDLEEAGKEPFDIFAKPTPPPIVLAKIRNLLN